MDDHVFEYRRALLMLNRSIFSGVCPSAGPGPPTPPRLRSLRQLTFKPPTCYSVAAAFLWPAETAADGAGELHFAAV